MVDQFINLQGVVDRAPLQEQIYTSTNLAPKTCSSTPASKQCMLHKEENLNFVLMYNVILLGYWMPSQPSFAAQRKHDNYSCCSNDMAVANGRAGRVLARPPFHRRNLYIPTLNTSEADPFGKRLPIVVQISLT